MYEKITSCLITSTNHFVLPNYAGCAQGDGYINTMEFIIQVGCIFRHKILSHVGSCGLVVGQHVIIQVRMQHPCLWTVCIALILYFVISCAGRKHKTL